MRRTIRRGWAGVVGLAALAGGFSWGKDVPAEWAPQVVLPQRRVLVLHRPAPVANGVQIRQVTADVSIQDQTATTTLEVLLENPGPARLESQVILPVPQGAVVRSFTYQGAAGEGVARILPKDEARRIYDTIVAQTRDPALLEFIGCNLIKSSVFPVPPRSTLWARLTYENLLAADGDRLDYVLPRSEALDYGVPWKISVQIASKRPIATLYSPSHALTVQRAGEGRVSATVAASAAGEPGSFRLSCLLEKDKGGVSASLFAYPDPKSGGGYFLFLAGLPSKPKPEAGASPIRREVTLVLDRSGSMAGEKIEQVREAARQVVGGLADGEAFNVIVYNEAVEAFADRPVVKSEKTLKEALDYIRQIRPSGGTNIHDALVEALRPKPAEGMLPLVLFLTDGLPTVGPTSETAIRELAMKGNPHKRRVFTFGVGVDVNTPLLEKIASETRAASTFVLPKEDVEMKVGQVFRRLSGPVLADPKLEILDAKGAPARSRVQDLIPAALPDLFDGDQLVLAGRYAGEEPLAFRVSGNYLGAERNFEFSFPLDAATVRNGFVPRLWAGRKIALLIDAIRQMGGDARPGVPPPTTASNPRMKELVDEVVRLSTEFGILTEYTAFLATDGAMPGMAWNNSDIRFGGPVLERAKDKMALEAQEGRSGWMGVQREENLKRQKGAAQLNMRNAYAEYVDGNVQQVQTHTVQQAADRAYYKSGAQWVDGKVSQEARKARPKRTVAFASDEYFALADRLARENRQTLLAMDGEILIELDGETVLIEKPAAW